MYEFLKQLQAGVLLGDGAIGTLLHQRGQPLNACYDALVLNQPEIVARVHRDYLDTGARLIETNTYGANRLRLEKFGLADRVREVNEAGAKLAADLAHERGAFAAGSVGPLGTGLTTPPTDAERAELHREQFAALQAGGVDAIFLESFARVDELEFAVKIARSLGSIPIIASLSFGDDGHTADGFRIAAAFTRLRQAGADVTGLNCGFGPTLAEKLLRELPVAPGDLISVYPNAGRPYFFEGRYIYQPTPGYFADFVPKLAAQGARLIGGCCGTTPETIAAMARVISGIKPTESKAGHVTITKILPVQRPVEVEPPTLLDLSRRQTLIVTELDPPKSLGLEKLTAGTRALREAGTDFVTLADNSLAILRVSNMAAGIVVRDRAGIEPLIHLACRDKNLLGLQSELMGLHALGIHHVLALTGDPAKVGDHRDATSVYDVNSIGLIRLIAQLNNGLAANGRDLKGRTRFVIGCAFNPNVRNLDSQVRKLEDKLKAGAHFVMTQPIFDPLQAKAIRERLEPYRVPVLVGVMPLLNSRNAEFLHNEVPGIVIPDTIRERLRGKEGPEGNAEGLAIARELCDAVLDQFRGIYLITPLLRYDLTVELSRYIREPGGKRSAPNATVPPGTHHAQTNSSSEK